MNQLKSVAVLMAAVAAGWAQPSLAQSSTDDPLALKLANAVSPDRFFVRAGVIGVKIKTESGDAYDVTGPLVTREELQQMVESNVISAALIANGVTNDPDNPGGYIDAGGIQQLLSDPVSGIPNIIKSMDAAGRNLTALGAPRGVKAVAKESVGTAGISLGMFLDDEYKWAVEAYVLAIPPKASVNIAGPSARRTNATGTEAVQPFPLQGQKIIDTKLFPPLLMLGRYWGNKDSRFRPYTGVIGMYAMFYDTKATDALNYFVGGQNPGDTTVSFKNTFGMGPMLGGKFQINDSWHVNLNIGHVKLKTVGTLVTRNTLLTQKTTGVLAYGDDPSLPTATTTGNSITSTLQVAEAAFWGTPDKKKVFNNFDPEVADKFDSVRSIVSRVVAYQRHIAAGGDPDVAPDSQGTFVRKSEATLKNTLFMLSVGRTF
jgi:outer membrane protein